MTEETQTEIGGPSILVVVAPFYQHIADMLTEGCVARLEEAGADVDVVEVPGALEIPPAIRIAMEAEAYDGFVALGCVLRGETSHYDTVCNESARGLMTLGVEFGVPIGNGILTCEKEAQALDGADPARKNKGAGAAEACLALLSLRDRFAPIELDLAFEDEDGESGAFLPDSAHFKMANNEGQS